MVRSFQITCDENASQYMKQKQEEVEPSRISTNPSSSPPASTIHIESTSLNCCAALIVRARSIDHDETDRVARRRSRVPVDVWHSSGCSAKLSAIFDNSCANPGAACACFDACVSLSVAAVALRG